MLKPAEKRYLTEIADYFFRTTSTSFDDYVKMAGMIINQSEILESSELTYPMWLLNKCMEMLEQRNIPRSVCIENKDVFRAVALGEVSREEGEFYTPEVWCSFGREYMKKLIPCWGTANVWDIACGTGNLMRTSGYDPDKLFLSTLLEEDVETVERLYPEGITAFTLDACNGIDYDEYNRMFSRQLPEKLIKRLEANEPLIFYINPPYKSGYGDKTDIAQHMAQAGYGHSATDIYHHFLYRICLLVDTYHLTNVHIGVFGPTGWLLTHKGKPFRDFIFEHFRFQGGMSFKSSEFANVGDGNDWTISMSVWSTNTEPDKDPEPVILDYCERDSEGIIRVVSPQLIKPTEVRLHDWIKPNDVDRYTYVPQQTAMWNFGTTLKKEAENAIMALMSDNTVIDGVRRAALLTYPNGSSLPVTAENYWRCVASYGARNVTDDQDAYLGRQVFSAPDTSIEGYDSFLADSFSLWVFGMNSYCYSYRDIEVCGEKWTHSNNIFPLPIEDCKKFITDPALLADMEAHPADNDITVKAMQWAYPKMGDEARELFDFGLKWLAYSLSGTIRKDLDYNNGTIAYDASITQLRNCQGLWDDETLKTYKILNSKLRASLKPRVAKYGFIIAREDR